MSELHNTVSLNILDKLYKVKCPSEKITELRESAYYLESKMRELSQSGKILSGDRLAVIAALNVVNELLMQKKQVNMYVEAMGQRIRELQNKVEDNLASIEQIEV